LFIAYLLYLFTFAIFNILYRFLLALEIINSSAVFNTPIGDTFTYVELNRTEYNAINAQYRKKIDYLLFIILYFITLFYIIVNIIEYNVFYYKHYPIIIIIIVTISSYYLLLLL